MQKGGNVMSLPIMNHTQISNDFIDKWMPAVEPEETVLFLAIARATIGWHKETDAISLTQLEKKTGLSRNTVIKHTEKLVERGLILKKQEGRACSRYTIDYERVSLRKTYSQFCPQIHTEDDEKVCKNYTGSSPDALGSSPDAPVLVHAVNTQKKKETKTKDISRRSAEVTEMIQIFRDKGSDYYHDGRESKALKELEDRFVTDRERFISIIDMFLVMKKKDKFYRGRPFAPSTIQVHWNDLADKLPRVQFRPPSSALPVDEEKPKGPVRIPKWEKDMMEKQKEADKKIKEIRDEGGGNNVDR